MHDAAIVALRLNRDDGELRRHRIANESRPLVARLVAEHGDHGLGELATDRRRAERAKAEQQKSVRQRRIPAFGARVIGIVVKRMRVAGHCREGGKMFVAQSVWRGLEDFTGREIVEVTLRHRGNPLAAAAFIYSLPPVGEGWERVIKSEREG